MKYDGYRLRLERDGDHVRLITRNSHNWTDRYPWIVEAALKNRIRQFVIDGEAVVLGVDGVADFNALHSRRHDEVQLYAFGGAADHEDIGKRSTIDVVAGGAVNTTVSGWLKSENERRAEGHKVKKALFP